MVMPFNVHLLLPLMALGIDLVLGDPRVLPHPVQGIGRLLDTLENMVRPVSASRLSGVICLCIVLMTVGGIAYWGTHIPVLGLLVSLYLAWSGLALGSLLHECASAAQAVARPDLAHGRAAVAMLVSRDVSQADRDALYRALAETLSENFNDGFVAPFFWLVLGGPVGLWLYKAVSTMDSMWGYKTERWLDMGWAGAKLDDCLAYVPARLSALLLAVSVPVAGIDRSSISFAGLWQRVAADARTMESPNAGWPMSMAAWLHGRHMGGATVYFGKLKNKPLLGPRGGQDTLFSGNSKVWDAEGMQTLLRHVRIAAIAGGAFLWLAGVLV